MRSCSIVIPTHNRADLLKRAVRSALVACPVDGEVLVVDDKSRIPATEALAEVTDQRLRIVLSPGASKGAASARNWGVAQANAELIFFLDDDDEILPDYCQRVVAVGFMMKHSAWGFASTVERWGDPSNLRDIPRKRVRLKRGEVGKNARPHDLIAAVSDGFWIQRDIFLQMGGFNPSLTIDEDTDLCVRLIASNHMPWYEVLPATVVYRGYQPVDQAGAQLTIATPSVEGVICYRFTHDNSALAFKSFSAMRWFLCTRYLRKAAKAGLWNEAMKFAIQQNSFLLRWLLIAFVQVKKLSYR